MNMLDKLRSAKNRDDAAQVYARLIRALGPASPEWSEINAALLERYSLSGLGEIKRRAWKLVRASARDGEQPKESGHA